jgi:hypothetical protein
MRTVKDYLMIIVTFFGCVFLYEYTHKPDVKSDFSDLRNYNKIKEIHDTIYKTNVTTRWVKGNSIPYVIIDSVQNFVHDTVFVLRDYNTIKAYSDTIRQDSNTFVIEDTISQNSIKSRSFTAQIKERTILVKEFYAEKRRNSLYWGFRGDFSPSNGLEVLSPGLMLNAKNKALMGLNLNINKNFNISYSGSVYFKIGKK